MRSRWSAAILGVTALVGFAALPAARAADTPDQVPSTCPITKPPKIPYTPPPPYPPKAAGRQFWYGTEKLWTHLPADGTWGPLPYNPAASALRNKLIWYRNGYDTMKEPNPRLIVSGKRLDAAAAPLRVDGPHGAWSMDRKQSFMTVGLNIPTAGCWEITGQYEEDQLSFVVWVP